MRESYKGFHWAYVAVPSIVVLVLGGVIVGLLLNRPPADVAGSQPPPVPPVVVPPVVVSPVPVPVLPPAPNPPEPKQTPKVSPAPKAGAEKPKQKFPPPPDGRPVEKPETESLPIPARALDPYVYLEDVDPYGKERPPLGTGLLRREMYRQGLLLAAREELGLTTRDAALGEVAPHGLPSAHRIRVQVKSLDQRPPRVVTVEAGSGASAKVVWLGESRYGVAEEPNAAAGWAEQFSREDFVTALQRAGGWKQPPPRRKSTAAVPRRWKRPSRV